MKIEKGHYVPKELITSEAIHEAVVKAFVAAGFYREKTRGAYPCEYPESLGLSIDSDGSVCWGVDGGSAKAPLTFQQLFTAENGLQWPEWAECIKSNGSHIWFDGKHNYKVISTASSQTTLFGEVLATRQPKEKEVNEALDKAVIDLSGLAVNANDPDIYSYVLVKNKIYINSKDDLVYLCELPEFEKRAKELGFISGYRWGIEYATNGKRPELADDIICSVKDDTVGWCSDLTGGYAAAWKWSSVVLFKITDQRYKPADTSYLQTPEVEAVEEVAQVDWYDYEKQKSLRLPDVGARCEFKYKTDDEWQGRTCLVIGFRHSKAWLHLDGNVSDNLYIADRFNFRPLDHATRKAELEKRRVVDAAFSVAPDKHKLEDILSGLYDLGYLRLPANKD